MTDKVAKLVIGDQTYEFPVLSGTMGPDVIDIRSLYAKTGHVHLRPRLHLDRARPTARSPTSTATRAS